MNTSQLLVASLLVLASSLGAKESVTHAQFHRDVEGLRSWNNRYRKAMQHSVETAVLDALEDQDSIVALMQDKKKDPEAFAVESKRLYDIVRDKFVHATDCGAVFDDASFGDALKAFAQRMYVDCGCSEECATKVIEHIGYMFDVYMPRAAA